MLPLGLRSAGAVLLVMVLMVMVLMLQVLHDATATAASHGPR
jgi:hypothetical protein